MISKREIGADIIRKTLDFGHLGAIKLIPLCRLFLEQ